MSTETNTATPDDLLRELTGAPPLEKTDPGAETGDKGAEGGSPGAAGTGNDETTDPASGTGGNPEPKATEDPKPGDKTDPPPAGGDGGGDPGKTDTPPGAPSADDQQKNIDALINETLGGTFNSLDALKAADIPGKLKELTALKDQIGELQAAAERSPFAHDLIKGLNEYAENGGTDFATFIQLSTTKFDELSADQVVAMREKFETPELSDAQIRRRIESKYRLGKQYSDEKIKELRDAGEDEAAERLIEERELAQAELTVDARRAKEYLSKYKKDFTVTNAQKEAEASEQAAVARAQTWEPVIDKIVDDFKTFDFPVKVKGEDATFQFEIPAEEHAKLNQELNEIIAINGWEHSPEMATTAKDILVNMYVAQNRDKILGSLATFVANQTDERWIKESHNTSGNKDPKDPPPAAAETETESYMRQMMDFEGMK